MSRYVLYPDELLHYGVKGMKWGVRRYQNYDGTRIGTGGDPVIKKGRAVSNAYRNSVAGGQGGKATGTARLAATAGGAKKNKNKPDKQGALDQTVPNGKNKPNISPAEKLARDSSNLASGGKELTRAIRDVDPRVKKKKEAAQSKQLNKAKKMSDQELRDSINRIKMEREYASLTTKETKSGYDKAMNILEISGKVLFIVATGISIASTIKKMKQSGFDTSEEEKALCTFLENSGAPEDIIVHAMELDTKYLEDWLEHYGVKGMKWGVRRYQNYDGTRIGVGSGAGGGGGGHYSATPGTHKARIESRRQDLENNTKLRNALGIKGESKLYRKRYESAKNDKERYDKLVGTVKKSITGGQGGKAEGTARLAASSPFSKDNLAKKNAINTIKKDKDLSDLQKETLTSLIEGKEDAHEVMKKALDKTDTSSFIDAKAKLNEANSKVDWDKVTQQEIAYDQKFIDKAIKEIETKYPDIYESVLNDCKKEKFDITSHKVVNMYAFNMDNYNPDNRPKSKGEKAADKAFDSYYKEMQNLFTTIVGSKALSDKTDGAANMDKYWDVFNDVASDYVNKRR